MELRGPRHRIRRGGFRASGGLAPAAGKGDRTEPVAEGPRQQGSAGVRARRRGHERSTCLFSILSPRS
jgi:hypothetical protein